MTAKPDIHPLRLFYDALFGLVADVAPALVSVHSHRPTASGFVWKPGLVVTEDESLAEEREAGVVFAAGRRAAATIAGRDSATDVALLRVATDDIAPVELAVTPSATGALAVAVGARDGAPVAAFGSVAISEPGWRSLRGGEIDARLELGLSLRREAEGGLAFDAEGAAFGMTLFGPRRRVLVIPAATIASVAGQLEANGRIARGYLGLGLQPVRLDGDQGMGAKVMSVDAQGPGAKAGVHQGDVIHARNGEPVGSVGKLLRSLGPDAIGNTVALALQRGGYTRTVDLVIGERP